MQVVKLEKYTFRNFKGTDKRNGVWLEIYKKLCNYVHHLTKRKRCFLKLKNGD